jgi:transcriptional regulator with XRE-family HTH domain
MEPSVETRLREAIANCQISTAQLARRACVPRQSIQRFLRGGGLSLPNLEAVAQVCGLRLTLFPIETQDETNHAVL